MRKLVSESFHNNNLTGFNGFDTCQKWQLLRLYGYRRNFSYVFLRCDYVVVICKTVWRGCSVSETVQACELNNVLIYRSFFSSPVKQPEINQLRASVSKLFMTRCSWSHGGWVPCSRTRYAASRVKQGDVSRSAWARSPPQPLTRYLFAQRNAPSGW